MNANAQKGGKASDDPNQLYYIIAFSIFVVLVRLLARRLVPPGSPKQHATPQQLAKFKVDPKKSDFHDIEASWSYSHTIPDALNITDLSPGSFYEDLGEIILNSATKGEATAIELESMKSNHGVEVFKTCNKACRVRVFCELTNSVYAEMKKC